MRPAPPLEALGRVIEAALAEDLGEAGDITTDLIVPRDARMTAALRSREPGCIAGADAIALVLARFPGPSNVEVARADGAQVAPGDTIATLAGPARSLLTGERVILNVLGRLSGIATATAAAVRAVAGTGAAIKDTRKTTPGLRTLEKYAVAVGGGVNHRAGLYDAVLVKDNHIAAAGSVSAAVRRVREQCSPDMPIQVEVDTLDQLEEALACGVPSVLLDNMAPDLLRRAVGIAKGRCHLEASGGITPANVRAIAETGVDSMSLGWLTHSARALDLGLDIA